MVLSVSKVLDWLLLLYVHFISTIYIYIMYMNIYVYVYVLISSYFGCCGCSIIYCILVDALVVCDGDVGVDDVCVESFATKFREVKKKLRYSKVLFCLVLF